MAELDSVKYMQRLSNGPPGNPNNSCFSWRAWGDNNQTGHLPFNHNTRGARRRLTLTITPASCQGIEVVLPSVIPSLHWPFAPVQQMTKVWQSMSLERKATLVIIAARASVGWKTMVIMKSSLLLEEGKRMQAINLRGIPISDFWLCSIETRETTCN